MSASSGWGPGTVVRDGRPGEGLRVAVAGASHWHLPRHAQNLAAAGVTFVAVSDGDPAVAERWARELGCAAVPDTAGIVAARPDLVLAIGRVCDMAAQARTLLEAGLPLLAEKPLGLDAGQVAPLVELAAARRAWVAVALVQRYDPLWGLLDQAREAGSLGTLAHGNVRIVNGPPQRYAAWGSGWMLARETAGGGALLNLGIHGMDFLRHLAGATPEVVGAAISSRAHGQQVEDFGTAVLRAPDGLAGTVEAGYTYPDSAAGMTRSGDNETRVAATGLYLIGRDADVLRVTPQGGEEALPNGRGGDRYRDWIFDSLARFRQDRPPLAGLEDCCAAVRLVDAAYAAAGRQGSQPRHRSRVPGPAIGPRDREGLGARPA